MKKQNLARLAYTVLVFALAALAAGCDKQKQLAMCEGGYMPQMLEEAIEALNSSINDLLDADE